MGTDHGAGLSASDAGQRRTLIQVLLLNAGLSAALLTTGLAADSSGLIANALDNASDAAVYGISLFAVGRAPQWKSVAATVSGVLLLVFAAGVVVDVGRRFLVGAEPIGPTMVVMALVATAVNALCIKLLASGHRDDVNMRAAWTFSTNDFFSNIGILVAGGLVLLLGSNWPDLVIGLLIAGVAVYGGVEILRDAVRSRRPGNAISSDDSHD